MMIAKNDEEKRSKAWRVVMISATIIIMLVAVFFITRLFVENPLKGTWKSEDNNMTLMFNDKSLTVTWE